MLLNMIQKHFPSLPLSDEYTDWGKWLGFARAVYEAGRASTASVPEGQALWDSVYKTLRGYRMTMMVDSEGDGYPLIDAMSPEHGTVTSGIEECTYLADAIYNDLVAAAPTPPVSEDRWQPIETAPKDGSKFLAWRRHSTIPLIVLYNAEYDQYECNDGHLVFSLTHWMPLPKAPAMEEVGGKYCGYKGSCPHKVDAAEIQLAKEKGQ